MPYLIVTKTGSEEQRTIRCGEAETTIGRAEQSTLVLADDRVSRGHAKILSDGEEYFLVDLGSENGTLLNNVPVRRRERYILRSNDVLTIGGYLLRFSRSDDLEQSFNEITDSEIMEVKLLKKVLQALESEEVPSLEVLNGSVEGKKFLLAADQETFTVGRDPACECPIEEYVISRRHARIQRDGDGYRLEDLQSKNGTYVNNQRVEATALHDGDRIGFGTIVCLFRYPQEVSLEDVEAQVRKERPKPPPPPRYQPEPPPAATEEDAAALNEAAAEEEISEEATEQASGEPFQSPEAAAVGATTHAYPPPRPRRSLWQRLSPVEFGLLWGGFMVLVTAIVLLMKLFS
ncbi:MAG: FHA domain-containing protein [Deltaproteobacteria bacterium]|nr:FHA domain-containing protein [Deltaproteobacteria bacterium]